MPSSPSVLSAAKKNKAVKFSETGAESPLASSSKIAAVDTAQNDEEMVDDEDDDNDEPWEGIQTEGGSRTAAGHPGLARDGDEQEEDGDDAVMIDSNTLLPPVQNKSQQDGTANEQGLLKFPALSAKDQQGPTEKLTRKVAIPPHRMTPLKRDWPKIYSPLVDECGLMVRMNVGKKNIEMKTSKHTQAPASTILQRAVDFVTAYGLGFGAEDAVALLRMEDLFVETFEIRDVKTLSGDHLSRAIGRIAGKDGKTRFTIENVSRTRIVLADQKIHILGTFSSIKVARDAICALILGSPPGKVYNGLRTVAARQRQRF